MMSNYFITKIPFSSTRHQITYCLCTLEENEYAGIKYPTNLKHPPKKSSTDEDINISN